MKKTFLTQKRMQTIYNHLKKYLFELLEKDENYKSFADLQKEIECSNGLYLPVEYDIGKIKCMLYKWNGLDYEKHREDFKDNEALATFYWHTILKIITAMKDDDSEVVKGGWYYSQGHSFNYKNVARCGKWGNCYGNPTYRIRLYTGEVFDLVDEYGLDRMKVDCIYFNTRKEMRAQV